ncbi:MAG: hypothetical protein ABIC36_03955 [bacterium]
MQEFLLGVNLSKFNKKMKDFLKLIQKELDDFYNIRIEQPSIFFIDSRKEINKIWERETEEWLCAWAKDGNIHILNPEVYTKESSHKDINHFWQSLKHEYSHLYYRKITNTSCPKWLNEGLANYLAGQVKEKPTKKEGLMVFNYDYDRRVDKHIYKIGFLSEFLCK